MDEQPYVSVDEFEQILDRLEDNSIYQRSDVYKHFDLPLESECDVLLDFNTKALVTQAELEFGDALFIITNNRSFNAFADSRNSTKVIGFHVGLVNQLKHIFLERPEDVQELIHLSFSNIQFWGQTSDQYCFLLNSHFVFYHELGHLIQHSGDSTQFQDEAFDSNSVEYDMLHHLMELDADEFSSLCVGKHVVQYYQGIQEATKNQHTLAELLSCSIGSILIAMTGFYAQIDELYYEGKHHPHPMIRIVMFSITIIEYVKQDMGLANLDHTQIIQNALKFTINIQANILGTDRMKAFPDIIKVHLEDIISYVAKKREEKTDHLQVSAVAKWNERSTNNM